MEYAKIDLDKIEKQDTPLYIDLVKMRNALRYFKESGYTLKIDDLVKLALEKRVVIIASEEITLQ